MCAQQPTKHKVWPVVTINYRWAQCTVHFGLRHCKIHYTVASLLVTPLCSHFLSEEVRFPGLDLYENSFQLTDTQVPCYTQTISHTALARREISAFHRLWLSIDNKVRALSSSVLWMLCDDRWTLLCPSATGRRATITRSIFPLTVNFSEKREYCY